MIPGRSKSKGNRFENLVGRTLSEWLTSRSGCGDTTQLIPTRLSGGWDKAIWRQAGDLAPNGPAGERFRKRFIVECKHQKKDLLWSLYTQSPKENIHGWWAKLCIEAEELGSIPMLVFRQNARPILVALPRWLARHVHKEVGGQMLEYSSRVIEEVPIALGLVTLETLVKINPAKFYRLLPPKEQ